MKTREILEKLDIPKATLHKYIKDFNFNITRNEKNEYEFSDKDFETLQYILLLRNNDNGISTIQKKLGIHEQDMSSDESVYNVSIDDTQDKKLLLAFEKIENKFDVMLEQSEKYARATYELGKIQAEKQALEEKIKLISEGSNKDIQSFKQDNDKLINDIEKLKDENRVLTEALEREKSLPWYKKIFGK